MLDIKCKHKRWRQLLIIHNFSHWGLLSSPTFYYLICKSISLVPLPFEFFLNNGKKVYHHKSIIEIDVMEIIYLNRKFIFDQVVYFTTNKIEKSKTRELQIFFAISTIVEAAVAMIILETRYVSSIVCPLLLVTLSPCLFEVPWPFGVVNFVVVVGST